MSFGRWTKRKKCFLCFLLSLFSIFILDFAEKSYLCSHFAWLFFVWLLFCIHFNYFILHMVCLKIHPRSGINCSIKKKANQIESNHFNFSKLSIFSRFLSRKKENPNDRVYHEINQQKEITWKSGPGHGKYDIVITSMQN